MRFTLVFLVSVGLAAHASVLGEDWPQFRGPGASGLAEGTIPTEWGPSSKIAWKETIPGVAWACPIVVGDKVIVATAVSENQPKPRSGPGGGFGGGQGRGAPPGGPPGGGQGRGQRAPDAVYQWRLVALDRATGRVVWDELAIEAKPKVPTHQSNTFASETPASDGERVYSFFNSAGVLTCHDVNSGKLIWKRELGGLPMQNGWGTSSSPIVDGDRLFVQCDNEQKSFLVALDKMTGNEIWRVERPERTGWSTPYIWKTKGRTDLVTAATQKVRGYDPATGKLIWELGVGGGQSSASPVGDGEFLYVGCGGGGGGGGRAAGAGSAGAGIGNGALAAVKAGATGDITPKPGETASDGVAWVQPRAGVSSPTPLLYDGYVYLVDRQGLISCFDAKTGKPAYSRERIPGARAVWASPWAANGKVFCLDENGTTHVLKAGPSFEVIDTNKLPGEGGLFWATPAAAGGSLFVRNVDNLLCIRE